MINNIIPPTVRRGDSVGIISPCDVKEYERCENYRKVLEEMGLKTVYGKNAFRSTWAYAASAQERADDLNAMAADESVTLVFFGGGEAATEILPLIDYPLIAEHPKRYCSYSDSTSILNAITSMSNIVTYHGQSPRTLEYLSPYNRMNFVLRLLSDEGNYERSEPWTIFRRGKASGITVGGYTQNMCLLLSSPYFKYDRDEKYILFLEDHKWFSVPGAIGRYLAHIRQSDFFANVSALVFGMYSDDEKEEEAIMPIIARFAERSSIPVAKCRDFGHGSNNAIIPIGIRTTLEF